MTAHPSGPAQSGSAASPEVLAALHDVALLDLDGVVYVGADAVAGAVEGLAAARALGMRLAFVTNNASRPPEEVAAHLVDLGIPANATEVVTSAQAGADLLALRVQAGAKVLAVGGPGVALALERAGLDAVRADEPQSAEVRAVLQGFGRDVSWRDLAAAALAVQGGAAWIVTNPDLTLPVPGGRAPGNGSLARVVEIAAGRPPDDVAGKPHPALMRASIQRTGAASPLVVGDRLDTDIEGAVRVGVPSLLVLTGVTDIVDVLTADPHERPDYVGADLSALVMPPAATSGPLGPDLDRGVRRRGDARAWVETGELRVDIGGDWLAALQCACAAAWDAADAVSGDDRAALDGAPRCEAAAALLERARRGERTVDP